MTEPRRLLDGDGDELERALLDSAIHDGPSKRAGHKTLAALGIGSGLVATSAGVTTASAAAQAVGHGAAASVAQAAGSAGTQAALGILVKWVGIATVGGIATLSAADYVQRPAQPPKTATVVIAPVASKAEAVVRQVAPELFATPAAAAPPTTEPPSAELATTPETDPERTAPSATKSAAVAAANGDLDAGLGAEVQALDRARAAMQAGRPEAALRALGAYEREFATGALAPEARVLRIEALARAGRHAEARALGQQFLTHHPSSPLAQRVRSIANGPSGSD